ncbi:MAG: hypothetical protein FWC91_07080 [Defluviitaleaceae bacterium]|nr:hypothetical protein [Defluviitaleaceae bacterium]
MKSTYFDEYDLLELFNAEPEMIGSDEAGLYMYSKTNSNGVQILLLLSVHENKCRISLSIEETTFFKVELNNVENLHRKDGWLRIRQSSGENDFFICFYPIFYVTTGDTQPLVPTLIFHDELKGY